ISASNYPIPLAGLQVFDEWFAGAEEIATPLKYVLQNVFSEPLSILQVDGCDVIAQLSGAEWVAALKKGRDAIVGCAGQGMAEHEELTAVERLPPGREAKQRKAQWTESTKHAHFADRPEGGE